MKALLPLFLLSTAALTAPGGKAALDRPDPTKCELAYRTFSNHRSLFAAFDEVVRARTVEYQDFLKRNGIEFEQDYIGTYASPTFARAKRARELPRSSIRR